MSTLQSEYFGREEYAIYLRKSRKDLEAEEHGQGETLARHEKQLLDLAKYQHLNVTHIYREIVSGDTISARPVMQQLLSDVEEGAWAGILVVEVERLARGDTMDQGLVSQTFTYSATKIVTPMKTYDPTNDFDQEYFEYGLFQSRREYKTINRRLLAGRLASCKEGKWPYNKAPYGYKRKRLDTGKGWTLEIVPGEAEAVHLMYTLSAYGDENSTYLGTSNIAYHLNDLGIPSPHGGKWVKETIRGLLSNYTYLGMVPWHKRPQIKKMVDGQVTKMRPRVVPELYPGLHKPIIERELFDKVQDRFKDYLPVSPGGVIKNPLAGLVFCSQCGKALKRRPYCHKGTKESYPTLLCTTPGCPTVASYLSIVEDQIVEFLEHWLAGYQLQLGAPPPADATDRRIETLKATLEAIDKELSTLDKQLNNAHTFLEQEIYSIDEFLSRSKIIASNIEHAKAIREKTRAAISEEENRVINVSQIVPRVQYVLETYRTIEDPKVKNDMLRSVLEKVIYTKSKKGTRGKESGFMTGDNLDNFTLDVYPRVPKSEYNSKKSAP